MKTTRKKSTRAQQKARDFVAKRVEHLFPEPAPERKGNILRLLQQGREYFPALLNAIANAQREIRLETYIFANDDTGRQFCVALCEAALRGVKVHLVLDGFGGAEGVRQWVPELRKAGVRVRVFRPESFLFKPNPRRLRRMHRKIAVVDGRVAFVGGINLIDDLNHTNEDPLPHHIVALNSNEAFTAPGVRQQGLTERYDFAVQIEGPVVQDVWHATQWLWWQIGPRGEVTDSMTSRWWKKRAPKFRKVLAFAVQAEPPAEIGPSRAQFVLRDNFRFRRRIEKSYLQAIAHARTEVLLANAYFLPGRRFRRALKTAAARGVQVRLVLQGRVEHFLQHHATQGLYDELLRQGIEIYEYLPGFLHAKVAVVDLQWATVGSSNIDPFSLLFAREANVLVFDSEFAQVLQTELKRAIKHDCHRVRPDVHRNRPLRQRLLAYVCYRLLRLAVVVSGLGRRY